MYLFSWQTGAVFISAWSTSLHHLTPFDSRSRRSFPCVGRRERNVSLSTTVSQICKYGSGRHSVVSRTNPPKTQRSRISDTSSLQCAASSHPRLSPCMLLILSELYPKPKNGKYGVLLRTAQRDRARIVPKIFKTV